MEPQKELILHTTTYTDLVVAGMYADRASLKDVFFEYHQECAPHTIHRQRNDLDSFCAYLAEAGITREIDDLYHHAEAWEGMSYGLLRGFRQWLLNQGYSVGTINVRLSTIRQYCKLAGPSPEGAGILSQEALDMILTVKAPNDKRARNIDKDREREGIPTRVGSKKALATTLSTPQALQLKKTSKPAKRERDKFIDARDALLVGLMIEHALRCSEVAAMNVEDIDLTAGTITILRKKTRTETEVQAMKTHTWLSAEKYLALFKHTEGALFRGYNDQRLTGRAINARVNELGKQLGVEKLSPHDLRHFWAFDALRNGTPLDRVKSGGGWNSTEMVMRYAARAGITNEGVKITEE